MSSTSLSYGALLELDPVAITEKYRAAHVRDMLPPNALPQPRDVFLQFLNQEGGTFAPAMITALKTHVADNNLTNLPAFVAVQADEDSTEVHAADLLTEIQEALRAQGFIDKVELWRQQFDELPDERKRVLLAVLADHRRQVSQESPEADLAYFSLISLQHELTRATSAPTTSPGPTKLKQPSGISITLPTTPASEQRGKDQQAKEARARTTRTSDDDDDVDDDADASYEYSSSAPYSDTQALDDSYSYSDTSDGSTRDKPDSLKERIGRESALDDRDWQHTVAEVAKRTMRKKKDKIKYHGAADIINATLQDANVQMNDATVRRTIDPTAAAAVTQFFGSSTITATKVENLCKMDSATLKNVKAKVEHVDEQLRDTERLLFVTATLADVMMALLYDLGADTAHDIKDGRSDRVLRRELPETAAAIRTAFGSLEAGITILHGLDMRNIKQMDTLNWQRLSTVFGKELIAKAANNAANRDYEANMAESNINLELQRQGQTLTDFLAAGAQETHGGTSSDIGATTTNIKEKAKPTATKTNDNKSSTKQGANASDRDSKQTARGARGGKQSSRGARGGKRRRSGTNRSRSRGNSQGESQRGRTGARDAHKTRGSRSRSRTRTHHQDDGSDSSARRRTRTSRSTRQTRKTDSGSRSRSRSRTRTRDRNDGGGRRKY